jgi:hypothetical protein
MNPIAPILALLLACAPAHAADTKPIAGTRSYLALPVDATGEPARLPVVWERRVGAKHLVVLGTQHQRDPKAPMFDRIEAVFARVRPQVVLHESEAPEGLAALPRDRAIEVGAGLGFAVHLAAAMHAQARSGDAPVREEIAALLATHPARDVLVFLVVQRLIGNGPAPDFAAAAADYPAFHADYLVANGLPREPGQDTWAGFARAYAAVVGHPLSAKSWDPDATSAIRAAGPLSDLARATNVTRDRALLANIRAALRDHDRVVVVFGSWHVLALEPVLDQVLPHAPTQPSLSTRHELSP